MTLAQPGYVKLAFLIGLSSFFMLPVVGDVKPFDLLCLAFVALKLPGGFSYRRMDILFMVFIAFAVASLASARFVIEASALQTARYLVFFLVARLTLNASERSALTKGIVWSISANLAWIVLDLLQYYTVGACISLNEQVFPWVTQITTHRYPIELAGCAVLRPTGFTWDPGGLFPLMLVTAHAIGAKGLVALGSLFSVIAVSRTALITAFTILLARRSVLGAWALFMAALLVIPAVVLLNLQYFTNDLEDGTIRHLTYPGLALLGVFENPRYLLLGDGLRAGATMFMHSGVSFLTSFFTFDELLAGEARNLVVESIWVNQLCGAGVIGFLAYFTWLCHGLRNHPATLLGLLMAGTYYTFDSSVFCFLVPLLMTVSPSPRKVAPEVPAGGRPLKRPSNPVNLA